jgi:hypothetical protein
MAFWNHFRDGGWGMYPILVFGAALLLVALAYARDPHRRFVPLLVALGTLTMTAGGLGFVSGVIVSCEYAAGLPADQRHIIALGVGESLNNVAFALCFLVLAGVAASYGALKIARAQQAAPAPR